MLHTPFLRAVEARTLPCGSRTIADSALIFRRNTAENVLVLGKKSPGDFCSPA
jgi:hypothetical protein